MGPCFPTFTEIIRNVIFVYTQLAILDSSCWITGTKKSPPFGGDLAVILGGMILYAASRNWAALRKSSLLMSSDLTTLVIGRCLRTLPLALVIV